MHDNISHNICHVLNIFNIIGMFMIASFTCINIILHDMSFKKTVTYKMNTFSSYRPTKLVILNICLAMLKWQITDNNL